MTTRKFAVETRSQAVAIFGGQTPTISALTLELLSRGVHATTVKNLEQFDSLKEGHDPDYLVLFLDSSTLGWLEGEGAGLVLAINLLIKSGESRLITVTYEGNSIFETPFSKVTKNLIITNYFGNTAYFCPILELWLKSISDHKSLLISGDGLDELSILGEDDLVKLLAISILSPTTDPGEQIHIGNPAPVSVLSFAYIVRTILPFKVALTFDPALEIQPKKLDSNLYQKTLEKFDYQLSDNIEDYLKSFLESHLHDLLSAVAAKPILPTQAAVATLKHEISSVSENKTQLNSMSKPKPTLKKLTPLNTYQPIFVPLQDRKRKIKFSLPRFNRHPKYLGPPRIRTIIGRGLVIAIALYLGTIAFTLTIANLSLRQTLSTLRVNELPPSNKLNNLALTYLEANWVALTSIAPIAKQQSVIDISLLLDAYNQALSIFSSAEILSELSKELTQYVYGSGNADIAQIISNYRLQAEELYQKLSLLDGTLPTTPPPLIATKFTKEYQDSKSKLSSLKRSTTTTKAILAIAPDVVGIGSRRKYAVIFQNNMELRATGGFIGSFAILSFENGKLYDMPIYDVYDADSQLKGHVEPPQPIKAILGESNWYLRDSNFDPDFPTSARRIEWFIKKSLNQDLNGVIAVNINSIASLLSVTGPLLVSGYDETITDLNIFERTQFHAEGNFLPGSIQKKEFLSTVASALFANLRPLNASQGLKLISAFSDTVSAKNTLISLTSPASAHIFQKLGWDGEIKDLPCPSNTNCQKDYLMAVDSNFGVNKANYYIKRSIEENISLDKNLAVEHILRLKYQNTSTSSAWPAGAYKNYQRIYLPIGATISRITIGDKILDPKDYTVSSEHGKFVISYLVSVSINSSVAVEVQYTIPQLPQENEFLYTWYWQKQPGTSKDDTLTVYLNYPPDLKPVIISPQSDLVTSQLKFNFTNDTDHRVTVKFSK